VEIREGDALETLADIDGEIDLVLLDGAFSLYLPVLKLLEPHLKAGALIIGENAFAEAGGYLAHVRDRPTAISPSPSRSTKAGARSSPSLRGDGGQIRLAVCVPSRQNAV